MTTPEKKLCPKCSVQVKPTVAWNKLRPELNKAYATKLRKKMQAAIRAKSTAKSLH